MSMREDLAELLRLAIAAYGAKIVELQEIRERLARLIDEASADTAVKTPATQKKGRLSAAARTKISAAQKARWERARKEKAKKQKPNSVAKAAKSKVQPVNAVLVPATAKISPIERSIPLKNGLAKEVLALQEEEIRNPQTPRPDVSTPAGIVEQMALAGARFRITRGGSLIVGNLGSLPPAVQQMFIDYPNPHLLTAAARRYLAGAGQTSVQ